MVKSRAPPWSSYGSRGVTGLPPFVFSLRVQFLKCREAWLAEQLGELDDSNSYDYLKRMTEAQRVQLFDVVTQYRAIFVDDSSGQEESMDGGLLYSWAMHRLTTYLALLAAVLPKIADGTSLASIHQDAMVRGTSDPCVQPL